MSNDFPSISIVTPSLNQGQFIEATIRSVLSQNYPRLEFIVADGGSTDNTLEILKKFGKQIRWFSEKDEGQADALNKGLQQTSGEILAYLNADDILLPSALFSVAEIFSKNPKSLWLTGRCIIIDEHGKKVRSLITLHKNMLLLTRSYKALLVTNYFSQPATFWRSELTKKCGYFDKDLKYVMDYEYWLRLWGVASPYILHKNLAAFRIHKQSKTTSTGHTQSYIGEEQAVIWRYSGSAILRQLHNAHRLLMTGVYSRINR